MKKAEFILNEALSMSPNDRAQIARCLIYSLDQSNEKNDDDEWVSLAEKRLEELENGSVIPVSWEDIKLKIKNK